MEHSSQFRLIGKSKSSPLPKFYFHRNCDAGNCIAVKCTGVGLESAEEAAASVSGQGRQYFT